MSPELLGLSLKHL